ncbi:hypothetical protein [Leptothoe spongobia]|uniref:Uncharacterized protein n=1 Tax=Leptothoe spongobia TAU-MAC 1115 TaxID=1967444 RepID=A0A947GQC0_9CYAN|nr:hypothetical protein [Leptothoe spongobia]MBT9316976.1 hypothetical protein [Leptothoe spongobia TAU-MAC 1115]
MKDSSIPPSSIDPSTSLPSVPPQPKNWIFWLLWIATAMYVGLLLLSPPGWLPGDPVWAIQPDTIQEIL